jgi:endoglycosylceramidase
MAVAGDPVSFAFDDDSRTFTLSWRPDPSLSAPTEIAVPMRTYPDGYVVSCSDCATERRPGRLWVTDTPGTEVATVVVVPRGP